ncbi:MAG: hypothetical protein VKK98_10650 [Cyanobacteriota bacterium]|nr:hypothetical protein [Cyanobacteriota bacterium]
MVVDRLAEVQTTADELQPLQALQGLLVLLFAAAPGVAVFVEQNQAIHPQDADQAKAVAAADQNVSKARYQLML